jgi:hypothetical protein
MHEVDVFEKTWDEYLLFRDCLKIAQRAVPRSDRWLQRTQFIGMSSSDAREHIARRFDDLEDRTVVALWTRFERFVIAYLQARGTDLSSTTPPMIVDRLHEHILDAIERSRFDELLNILSGIVDSHLLGDVKKVKQYRDWVVHANPRKPKPDTIDAKMARQTLSSVVDALSRVDPAAVEGLTV